MHYSFVVIVGVGVGFVDYFVDDVVLLASFVVAIAAVAELRLVFRIGVVEVEVVLVVVARMSSFCIYHQFPPFLPSGGEPLLSIHRSLLPSFGVWLASF